MIGGSLDLCRCVGDSHGVAGLPQTSDNFPLIHVAGVAIVSLAALCFLFLRKKNR